MRCKENKILNNDISKKLSQAGFNFGISGAHSARSMMLKELRALLESTDRNASYEDYKHAVIDRNVLQKPTENSRKLTLRHLKSLYGLSQDILIFRVFRQWWDLSESHQPLLALQLVATRDPLLRTSIQTVLSLHVGEELDRSNIESQLIGDTPERFSTSSIESFARNICATWKQAGFLKGSSKKNRTIPKVGFVNIAYALFLANCEGLSGRIMFESKYCELLGQDNETLYQLAHTASVRGLLVFKHASEVIVINFPEHTTK